jgi:hypothetical protein
MPHLRHLSINMLYKDSNHCLSFPGPVLAALSALTYLKLDGGVLIKPSTKQPNLNPVKNLHFLKNLQHLHLGSSGCTGEDLTVTTADMSSQCSLTSLSLTQEGYLPHSPIDAGVLGPMDQLRVVDFSGAKITNPAQVATLLSQLGNLLQLKHLGLQDSLRCHAPSTSEYTSLTASSKQEHLDLRGCRIPAEAWPCMLPAGRQPPLQRLLRDNPEV